MIKTVEGLCHVCRTLANPTCECGLLATLHSSTGLLIYSDDLTKVSLANVWSAPDGRLLWLEEVNTLPKAKVSTIFDISI